MSERLSQPQSTRLILPHEFSDSEKQSHSIAMKDRSYDYHEASMGSTEPRDKVYEDILNPANVLELKEKIKYSLERSLESDKLPQNLRLGRNIVAEKDALKKKLIEEYLQTGNSGKSRIVPKDVRQELNQMLDLGRKELEAKLSPVVKASEPKAPEPVPDVDPSQSPAQPSQPEPSEGLTQAIPVIKVEGSQKPIPPAASVSDENTKKVGLVERAKGAIKEKLNRRRAVVATAIAITALAGVFGAGSVSKKSTAKAAGIDNAPTLIDKGSLLPFLPDLKTNDPSKDINVNPLLPTQLQMGSERASTSWDSQARHEDHSHNKTVEGGFEKGATPEQAGDQLKKFLNHRGEVLSIFMYAAKNGISVDKARANVGEISQQTKKIITQNGVSLTEYGEDQAKAAQHLIGHAKLSWASTAELQSLYNSGVLENQNPSGRDDELVINETAGFDANVRVLKIELENGNIVYLKGNCVNFMWQGAPQREVFTTFTHQGRTVTVTIPPSRTPVTPGKPRQPKQPDHPSHPKQPKQPKKPEQPITPITPATPVTPPGGLEPKDKTKDINVNSQLPEEVGMGDVRVDGGEQKPATPPPAEYIPPPPPVSTEPAPGAEPVPVEAPPPPPPEEGTGTTTSPNNGTVQAPL